MFDPTYPPTDAEIQSAPLRDQFNSLKALIDALPPPGVSQAQLGAAIQTTSSNSDTVDLLNLAASDSDVQTIADKVDELIQTLRRN